MSSKCGVESEKLQVSVDSCPVNCIHWVEREELPVLEFLIQPQPKQGYGIFGGGWERPANVFMAAKSFNKQRRVEAENQNQQRRNRNDFHLIAYQFRLVHSLINLNNLLIAASASVEEETPAQAKARAEASMKIKMEGFSKFWHWQK